MNPLKKLVKELNQPQVTKGRVIEAEARGIVVMTKEGVIIAQRRGEEAYVVGDEVAMRNGALVGKLKNPKTLPVFFV